MLNRNPGEVNVEKQAVIGNTVQTPISIRSSSSSSEDLPEAAELYSTSLLGKAMRDEQRTLIFADKIPPTASVISTHGSRGVIIKSRAQLVLES